MGQTLVRHLDDAYLCRDEGAGWGDEGVLVVLDGLDALVEWAEKDALVVWDAPGVTDALVEWVETDA